MPNRDATSRWIKSFLQPVTYLGIVLGALTLAGLIHLIVNDRQDAYDAALRNGANLARVFEAHIARSMKSADSTLRILRTLYMRDPRQLDLKTWLRSPEVQNDLTLQFNITDSDGFIINSSTIDRSLRIYIGDREHFLFHARTEQDELYISKPIELRSANLKAIILSRRITDPDGSFGGIITATIDPQQFAGFYASLDLGSDGIASLVGLDGIIRARGGAGRLHQEATGLSIAKAEVFRRYQSEPTGSYWNAPGTVDPVKRLITYRVVEGFPLLAIVGQAERDIFGPSRQNALIYYLIAAAVLIGVAAAIWLGARREQKIAAIAASLAHSNMMLETALENLPQGVCMFDADGRLRVSNKFYGSMYGLTAEQIRPGAMLADILAARIEAGSCPVDSGGYIKRRMVEAFNPDPGNIVDELRDGRFVAITRRSMPDGGTLAIHQDITEQKRAEAAITHLAHYDGLTGLANRTLFLEHVSNAAARCRRSGDRFAIHLLDLDQFKEVNDTLGHFVGDALLKEVAKRLSTCVRDTDVVARLGGDEFAVLQTIETGGTAAAATLAQRILQVIGNPYEFDGHRLNVGTSIGIAIAPDDGSEIEPLMKRADLALYRAKSEGRNAYRFFEPGMETIVSDRRQLEIDLRVAIANNELEVHYQPVADTGSRTIHGVEALVRWRHPQRGLVTPDRFIPIAEETGLILPVGEWVLRTACADAATLPGEMKVAVNLSSIQFRDGNLLKTVTQALADAKLPAQRLELEITESVLLQNTEENIAVLYQLRALGVSIVLDDFGIGYSSLSYLQNFPFDRIKIDRSFVANLPVRPDCAAIVCAVTSLARSLNMATTGEGVETLTQLELLHAAGCTQAQGYLFGRPCPISELDLSGAALPAGDKAA